MRTYHSAVFLLFLPGLLEAQIQAPNQPILVTHPGIAHRLERYEPLSHTGNLYIGRFTMDSHGFLWFATSSGLARFDGYDMKMYGENLSDTAGNYKTRVQMVVVDGEGFVWGATLKAGLLRLDPTTGKKRWYQGPLNDSTGIGPGALRLFVSSDGELWAGAWFGLVKYDRSSDSFVGYPLPPDCPDVHANTVNDAFRVTSICELGRSIWVGLRGGGLGELNRDTGIWKRYAYDSTSANGPSSPKVRSVCPDLAGRLWLGTNGGDLDCFNPQRGTWRHFAVTKSGILPREEARSLAKAPVLWWIVRDGFGGLWITAVTLGIYRLDPTTGDAVLYRHDSTDANSLPYDSHNWLAVTGSGQGPSSLIQNAQPASSIVWLPCGAFGVYRFVVNRDPCTTLMPGPPKDFLTRGLGRIGVFAIESPGMFWAIQMNGRLGIVDAKARAVRWHPDYVGGLRRFVQLRDKTILVASIEYEAFTFDREDDKFYPLAPDLSVTCFLESSDSTVWLGCRKRSGMTYLAAYDRSKETYTVYPRQDPDSSSHVDDDVTAMCMDGRGALWYGTAGGGLIHFDLKSKAYRRYPANPSSDNGLMTNGVNAIVPDSGGKLWIGTIAGLTLMDVDRGTFEHMHNTTQENTEPLIMCMSDDGEGHLWIASREGPFCFTKAARTLRMVRPPNQIPSSNIWSTLFDPQTRTITFGGSNGFFSFPIDDPPPLSSPPAVALTSFKVFEKDHPLDADISTLRSISLPHSASFFSLTFAALDYMDPTKNRCAYQMEGVDPEWVQAGARRYVSYTNLDPGTYTFKVRGANSEGIWSEKATTLEIVILPPWYRTTLAYTAYFLCFIGLMYVLRTVDRRRTALKHSLEMKSFEAAKMRDVDQMKSAFFANISHEFRTPLTLILGPLEQFADRFKHDEQAQATVSMMRRNGLRLLQLINQLLDLSRMDAGKMTLQVRPVELVALSRSLVMSFQSFAERKKIVLIFDPEEDEIIAYSDRDKFEKILTNLISNALKFTGEGGEVKAALRLIPRGKGEGTLPATPHRLVELVVSDTGIGIEPTAIPRVFDRFYQVETAQTQAQGGAGIGLALAKELVELMRGQITVQSTPGHGCTFVVHLPLSKEEWQTEEIVAEEHVTEADVNLTAATGLAEEPASEGQNISRTPSKPLVLIVEDNADVRKYVRGFLEKEFDILEAVNGKEALEKARETSPDLVISDVMMPVMDGVQLCRELKGDDRTSHIPVILLTSKASTEGKLEGLEIGADDYIIKPFEARELTARAKNLIETRKRLWRKYHRQVTLGPENIAVTSADERFLKRLSELFEEHIADADYDSEALAHDICMSRMQLNRKLNALTGHSTHEVVREFRLQRAAKLLRGHANNITGVAYDVGFNSLSHFARAFRERFGVVPSEYAAHAPQKDGNVS